MSIRMSATLLLRAIEVFGSGKKAFRWLETPKQNLNGRKPQDVYKTNPDKVIGMLDQIDHGMVA